MAVVIIDKWSAHCVHKNLSASQNLSWFFFPVIAEAVVPITHTRTHTTPVNDSWLHEGCVRQQRANLFPDTHVAHAVCIRPSLAFNCTWYLSAWADRITSGSFSCLCCRLIPLYTPHFPSCPSDRGECHQLGASGLCINYKNWGGYSESGPDSISARAGSGRDGEEAELLDRAVVDGRTREGEQREASSHLRMEKRRSWRLRKWCWWEV